MKTPPELPRAGDPGPVQESRVRQASNRNGLAAVVLGDGGIRNRPEVAWGRVMSGIPDEGVDGDRPGFDGALTQVLEAIGGLHAQMSTAIAHPGSKLQADALATVIGQTASIVGCLAAELAAIEKALEQEAYTASRYGVKIGVDRQPPPVPAGPPVGAAASERHWALAYRQAFERTMAEVRRARQRAASQLMDLYAQLDGQLRAVESELAFRR